MQCECNDGNMSKEEYGYKREVMCSDFLSLELFNNEA